MNRRNRFIILLLILAPIFSVFKVSDSGLLIQDLIFAALTISILPKLTMKLTSNFIFTSIYLVFSLIAIVFIGLEHIRLMMALMAVLVLLMYSEAKFVIYYSARIGSLIASVYLICTLLLFLIFGINISLDFGEYAIMPNTWADVEYIENTSQLKLGGLFREPNWFAVYACMGLYSFLSTRNYVKFAIVCVSMVLSNSAFAHVICLLSIVAFLLQSRHVVFIPIILLISLSLYGALGNDFFFRTFNIFDEESSSIGIRVIYPWTDYFGNINFLPTSYKNSVFANTAIVMLHTFGVFLGVVFVIGLGVINRFSLLYLFFVLAIISEGFYGRAEFVLFLTFLALPTKKSLALRVQRV